MKMSGIVLCPEDVEKFKNRRYLGVILLILVLIVISVVTGMNRGSGDTEKKLILVYHYWRRK